jgi:hypothetical protein
MTDEEKVLWKLRVFQDCDDVGESIMESVNLIQKERSMMQEAIVHSHRVIDDYQEAVDRIGIRA